MKLKDFELNDCLDNFELRDYLRENMFFKDVEDALKILADDNSEQAKQMKAWLHYVKDFEENPLSLAWYEVVMFVYRLDGITRAFCVDDEDLCLYDAFDRMALTISNMLHEIE